MSTGHFFKFAMGSKPPKLNSYSIKFCKLNEMHIGENDSHKRQFLALGVGSQSWKLNNLSNLLVLQAACYNLTEIFFYKFYQLQSFQS